MTFGAPASDNRSDAFLLDDAFRGVPPGAAAVESSSLAPLGWRPSDGRMALPLLSVDTAVFDANVAAMLSVTRGVGAVLAPHVKTPMSPALARRMLRAGAWGVSVADIRQASVMLRAGLRRIVLSNEIGGRNAVRRLAALLESYPDAEFFIFVDSAPLAEALATVWGGRDDLPEIAMLLEVGCGRGGVRTDEAFDVLLAAVATVEGPRLRLGGIATYEGTAMRPDDAETAANVSELFGRVASAFAKLRRHVGPDAPLLLSAGGSALFDRVIVEAAPILKADGNATLMLRSGACYYSDHGPIRDRLRKLAERSLLGPDASRLIAERFDPALRLWSEVLTLPSPDLAVCGLGLRDVAHDQGLPVPLRLWRNGAVVSDVEGGATVPKLNDQHAFVAVPEGVAVEVGDVIEFGIRHPCTTIDKHDVIYGLCPDGAVHDAFKTYFG